MVNETSWSTGSPSRYAKHRRMLGLRQRLLPVEGLEDAFAARHRAVQHVVLLAHGDDGPEQHVDELREEHHAAQADDPFERFAPPEPQHRREPAGSQALDERVVDGLDVDRALLLVAVVAVDLRVGLEVAVLPAVQLHDLHAREVLLQVLIQAGDAVADLPVEASGETPERPGGERHDGHRQQQDPGELRGDPEHHHQRDEEGHQLAQQQADAGQQLEEHLDVVGDAGHHAADRDVVEERRGPVLEVPEEVLAQVPQRQQHRAREQDAVQEEAARPQHDHPGVERAGARDRREAGEAVHPGGGGVHAEHGGGDGRALGHEDAVDHHARDHEGSQHRQHRGGHHEEAAGGRPPPVRSHPVEQAPQQPEAEGLSGELGVEDRVVAVVRGVPGRRRAHAVTGSGSRS
jgi:hypothetical protein